MQMNILLEYDRSFTAPEDMPHMVTLQNWQPQTTKRWRPHTSALYLLTFQKWWDAFTWV